MLGSMVISLYVADDAIILNWSLTGNVLFSPKSMEKQSCDAQSSYPSATRHHVHRCDDSGTINCFIDILRLLGASTSMLERIHAHESRGFSLFFAYAVRDILRAKSMLIAYRKLDRCLPYQV